ncbi:unnamed protein product [Rotaria socialis]|uniref:TTF-type domain-containing protein n=1 Tax=Rotaria socialis TaxID=392032 RepID=A0A821UW29_9BILA|nr:unnamed protein product [Rotaria socialis]CAF4895824.1 unnamed protein product [Rotaria socialis]
MSSDYWYYSMDHNNRRTSSIDSYFSFQKKSKYQDIESNDTNIDQTSVISPSPSISSVSTCDQGIEADQWYQDRPWLEYSIKKDCAYCYYCRHFSFGSRALTKRKQHDTSVSSGFRNWKRTLEKGRGFDRHVTSQGHIEGSC